MATMESAYLQSAKEQLEARLQRLESLLQEQPSEQVTQLISEVDEALDRIDAGRFGQCTVCHESVEMDRLMHDPLISVCLGCLSPQQQRALEYDLQLAAQIHHGSLPASDITIPGWQVAYHYQPAGVIGGDYFDVLSDGKGGTYFLIADCAGEGGGSGDADSEFGGRFSRVDSAGAGSGATSDARQPVVLRKQAADAVCDGGIWTCLGDGLAAGGKRRTSARAAGTRWRGETAGEQLHSAGDVHGPAVHGNPARAGNGRRAGVVHRWRFRDGGRKRQGIRCREAAGADSGMG